VTAAEFPDGVTATTGGVEIGAQRGSRLTPPSAMRPELRGSGINRSFTGPRRRENLARAVSEDDETDTWHAEAYPMTQRRSFRHFGLGLIILLTAATVVIAPTGVAARESQGTINVDRGHQPVGVRFETDTDGEVVLSAVASAPGADWGRLGAESGIVTFTVDGRYATDLVVTSGAPAPRELQLGWLAAGTHDLSLRFASYSSEAISRVRLRSLRIGGASDADEALALRHAPVVLGRSIPITNVEGAQTSYTGPYQNGVTDTPLLAWHEVLTNSVSGNRVLEYSVIWSNEDGGTNSPALMARWGRTTDIEWIYRVEVDADGNRVPGTAVYQAANHATLPFAGTYEGNHPLLQTCTANNNMCDQPVHAGMRFFLDYRETRAADRAREVVMDEHPSSYQVMAAEMEREGKIESPTDPTTPELGDQRTYLYLEVDKDTTPPNGDGPWVGLAVGVRLHGDDTVYRSDHGIADWSIKRDLPAATTVELPAGTEAADIAAIVAYRVPVGGDTGASVTVTDINRAFFLGDDYRPQPSFIDWSGSVVLTPTTPMATIIR